MRIGVIGLGLMGSPMAARLAATRADVLVHSRRSASAAAAVNAGATWCDAARDLGACDVVLTTLPGPADVEAILLGPRGVLSGERVPPVLIDMSTVGPETVKRLDPLVRAAGSQLVDAPVSGGPLGAEAGTLAIMVGAPEETYPVVAPVLEMLGRPQHLGPVGAGQATKLANQMLIGGIMGSIHDALQLCERQGISLDDFRGAVAGGFGDSALLQMVLGKLADQDLAPGFKVSHFLKDLRLATETAGDELVTTPAVVAAYLALGPDASDLGTQALPGRISIERDA